MAQITISREFNIVFSAMLPVQGLTQTDVAALANGFATKAGWSVEPHLDYSEETSLVISAEDDAAPTFIVTRERAGLVLAACQDDQLQTIAIEQSAVGILRHFG